MTFHGVDAKWLRTACTESQSQTGNASILPARERFCLRSFKIAKHCHQSHHLCATCSSARNCLLTMSSTFFWYSAAQQSDCTLSTSPLPAQQESWQSAGRVATNNWANDQARVTKVQLRRAVSKIRAPKARHNHSSMHLITSFVWALKAFLNFTNSTAIAISSKFSTSTLNLRSFFLLRHQTFLESQNKKHFKLHRLLADTTLFSNFVVVAAQCIIFEHEHWRSESAKLKEQCRAEVLNWQDGNPGTCNVRDCEKRKTKSDISS